MPRDGSNVYSLPAGTTATTNTTIESAKYNAFVSDVETDLNTPRPIVAGGTGASSASAARTALGLAIGTDVQAYDAELTAIAALAVTDGNVIVGNGTTWVAESGATARASLGLTIGTDVQAYDAELTAIAGLTSAANKVPMFSGSGTATLLDFKDEDNMASDSATAVPSQQSVKAYVDANGGGLKFLSTVDLASDATADFTLTAGYDAYFFVLANVIPVNDQDVLWVRTSTDGGSTYDSSAGAYGYAGTAVTANSASAYIASLADTKIVLTGAVGSDVGEDGISGQVLVNGPAIAKKTQIDWRLGYLTPVPGTTFYGVAVGSGQRQSSADVDAVRFLFSTGNLESGTITLWGMKNA